MHYFYQMRHGHKQSIKKNGSYFLTLTVVDWIDVFKQKKYKDIIVTSLRYCIKNKGLNVYCYCLMPDHLHLIVNTDEPFDLKDVIRDFKKFTAKKILKEIQNDLEAGEKWMLKRFATAAKKSSKHKNYKFWQTGNHGIELITERFTWTKIDYVHNNPVKARLVEHPQDWEYSSSSNYLKRESVLPEVYCLTGRLVTFS